MHIARFRQVTEPLSAQSAPQVLQESSQGRDVGFVFFSCCQPRIRNENTRIVRYSVASNLVEALYLALPSHKQRTFQTRHIKGNTLRESDRLIKILIRGLSFHNTHSPGPTVVIVACKGASVMSLVTFLPLTCKCFFGMACLPSRLHNHISQHSQHFCQWHLMGGFRHTTLRVLLCAFPALLPS